MVCGFTHDFLSTSLKYIIIYDVNVCSLPSWAPGLLIVKYQLIILWKVFYSEITSLFKLTLALLEELTKICFITKATPITTNNSVCVE